MLKIQRFLTIAGIASLTSLAACGTTASTSGDATTDGTGSDATTGTDDTSTGDTVTTKTYKAILIADKSADPTFANGKCGSSPGSDIDAVGLYRGGKLIAVGKVGSANFDTSKATTCADTKNDPKSAEGPLDGHVYASKPDTGYISLNGGSIELQFGACKTGTKITDCDGAGDLVAVQSGDEIDVWEVDTSYKAGGTGPAAGNAYDGCVCYADEYEVDIRTDKGVDAGSIVLTGAGSKTLTVP